MSKKFYSFFILLTAFLWLGTGKMWGATPFTEGFESAVPPTGWSTIHVKGSSWSKVGSDYYMTVHGGSYHAKIGYSSSGGDNYLITPQLSPVVGETLKFYIGSTTWGGSTLTVEVSETTNTSASDFTTVLATYHSNVDMNKTWGDAKEISLSAYAGKNIYIAFHMVDNNGDNVYIDDVSIEAPVTCPKPGAPGASSITQTTATIAWAEGGSETTWNLRYKSASASDWTLIEGLTAKSHNLTGLMAGKTTYNYEVQADCGGGDASDWTAGTPFQTECGAISVATEDWKDGFEGYTAGFSTTAPGCWGIIGANASSSSYPRIHVTNKSSNSGFVKTGDKSLFVVSSSSADSYIIFPEFSDPLNTLQIAFSHIGEAGGYPSSIKSSKLTLGYVTDVNDATTFHALREEFTRSTSWTAEEESLAGIPAADLATARLAFKVGTSEANNYFTGIDDITISALPSCTKPTLNDATDQTFEGATFTWDGSATQYQYAVVASGASVETWSDATNAKTYTVTGKAAATTFDFYVRSYCGTSEQSDAVKKSFTTLAVTAPTAPQVANATTTTADFSWTAAEGVSGYQYVAALSGQEPDWNTAQNTTSTSVQLTNLLAGNTYVAYVRSYYSNNNCYSAAVASSAFDTQCEAKTIDADHTFTETFDAFHCWTLTDCASSTGWYENNKFRFFYGYANQYLISPEFDTDDKQVTVEFEYYVYSGTETFHVGYSTESKDLSAFTWSDEIAATNTSVLKYSDNLPAGVKYIAIKYTSYDKYYLYIDNFTVSEYVAPACAAPASVSVVENSTTPEGATFTWEGDADFFQYICVAGGTAEGDIDWTASTKVAKAATNQVVLSGKAAGTYDFYVRSWCSDSEQSDALKKSFTTATIPAPTIGTITATNNSANASWTAPTDISYTVQYQWSINGTDWSEPTSALSAAITSLEQNTSYTFYVRSYYDATHQSTNATKAFKTACDPITVAVGTPFEQNFDAVTANAIPDCWNNDEGTTTTASYKWKVVTGGTGGKCAMFNGTDNGLGKTNVFATPLIELNSDADLSFYWKNKRTGAYTVEISVDGAARTPLISSGLTGKDAWTLKEQPLSAYNGHTIQLFFCGTSANDGSANLYLDEFKITPITCRKPASDPVVTSKDDTHATLTWTAGGANTDYQFALALKDEAPVWEDANVVTALTKSFDDLTPLTWYDFYVRTYCDELNQSEARKVTFQTECASFVTLPFSEDFNGLADVTTPTCWNNDEGSITDEYKKWRTYSYNYLRFNSSTTDAGETSILATPTIQLGEGNLLTFNVKNPTGGDFKVQIEGEGIAREDLITGLTGLADWTLKYAAIPTKFNNKKVQLFFCATSNEGDASAYIDIDDVRVARGEVFTDTENNQSRFSTLKTAGETIDVIFNRTLLCNGDYNTFCLPFSLSAAQIAESPIANFKLKAFDYAKIENEELLIAITNASSIEAGVPYFIANQSNEANQTVQLYQDVVITADAPSNKANSDVTFQGVFTPVNLAAQDESDAHTQLFLAAGNSIYWPAAHNKTVKGFRAYFEVTVGGGALKIKAGMPARIVEHTDSATGIENTDADTQALKLLENGNVVIIRNGVKYTIQGQKIQ